MNHSLFFVKILWLEMVFRKRVVSVVRGDLSETKDFAYNYSKEQEGLWKERLHVFVFFFFGFIFFSTCLLL